MGAIGDMVFSINPSMPIIPDETSKIKSSWFMSPERTFLEFSAVTLVQIYLYVQMFGGGGGSSGGDGTGLFDGFEAWTLSKVAVQPQPVTEIDWYIGYLVLLHGVVILSFKVMRGRVVFMLQPCNINTWVLTWLAVSRSPAAVWAFNFYLHSMWGSWMGLLAADLRDYHNRIEIFFFFTMHILIIVLPFYWIAAGTFPVYPANLLGCYLLIITQHWGVYLPFSIVSGWHVNYMCQPPKQLKLFGQQYRLVTIANGFAATWITRSLATEAFVGLGWAQ